MIGPGDTDRILDAYLAPDPARLPDRVIDAALDEVARTPQRRALRVPWRFPPVPALPRATGIAAVALVAVVGAGALLALASRAPDGPGGPSTPATQAPTTRQSFVARGITDWQTFGSAIYGDTLTRYPAGWSVRVPATRPWRVGDVFPPASGDMPFADTFVSPGRGDVQIGLIAWSMPVDAANIETTDGLKAWVETFCAEVASSCDGFTQRAIPWAWDHGNYYTSAILVPTPEHQYAFLADCGSCLIPGATDRVTIVIVAREDGFPAAASYGGSFELLKSVIATLNRGP